MELWRGVRHPDDFKRMVWLVVEKIPVNNYIHRGNLAAAKTLNHVKLGATAWMQERTTWIQRMC